MKEFIISLILCGFTLISKGQAASVEKSVYGIQTGYLGLWVHNEARLSNDIALRSELGFDSGIFGGNVYDGTGFLLAPVFILEPRWYYNLEKRSLKSKNISGNSGNFVSLKVSYNPNWFVISNYDHLEIVDQISFIPTWGIRRKIGNHFNYEAGIGLGYRYIFAERSGLLKNDSEAALNLHLRIGYLF